MEDLTGGDKENKVKVTYGETRATCTASPASGGLFLCQELALFQKGASYAIRSAFPLTTALPIASTIFMSANPISPGVSQVLPLSTASEK